MIYPLIADVTLREPAWLPDVVSHFTWPSRVPLRTLRDFTVKHLPRQHHGDRDAAPESGTSYRLTPTTKDAVLRVGALLIVKFDWVVQVFQLTAAQQARSRRPSEYGRS